MPRKVIKGSTAAGASSILGSPFWTAGKSVTGIFMREWSAIASGDKIIMHEFVIIPPMKKIEVTVDKISGRIVEDGDGAGETKQLEKFSMGGLKGYQIALGDISSQGEKLQQRDEVTITCTGFQESNSRDKDDMALFEISISR